MQSDIVERLRKWDAFWEDDLLVAADEIERLRAKLAAAIKERDEAVELYTDLLRRLSGSTLPRHAFLSGDASEKEGGSA